MNKTFHISILNTITLILFAFCTNCVSSQIEYNWQNSQEGWVSASETNNGCQLFAQPEAIAMRAVLMQKTGLFNQDRINLSAYVAGTYFVRIMTPEGSKEIRITKQ